MFRWVLAIAAAVVGVDQATKWWAESVLADESIPVLGDLLVLRLTYNPGAAFSIGARYTWLFAIFAAVAVGVVVRLARNARTRGWAVALGLILGGAATHLIDRLAREPGFMLGHVVDFIDYGGLFVGNVADIALFVGVTLAVLLNLRGSQITRRDTVDFPPNT
ncbi:signal peptidase II [Allorhizocola rhizosphaerae]|uniref:signal peptidase II n=1 Tax=Allorhizocola rhizosphaerae TaxID=1872709 RepID=UPI000E3ECB40|nr:signal peptidase II [Allorhizocola rhizosphaerae]